MIQKILVGIDDSEASEKALEFAIGLAEQYSANILLLSVIPSILTPIFNLPPVIAPTFYTHAPLVFEEASRRAYEELISKYKKKIRIKIRDKNNMKISAKLVGGNPAKKIIEIATKENFDLIVIGSKDRSGFHKFFFGSTSDDVVDNSEIPVLVVK